MKNLYKLVSATAPANWKNRVVWNEKQEEPTFQEKKKNLDRTLARLGVTDEDLERLSRAEDEYRLRALYSPDNLSDFSEKDEAFVKKCFEKMGINPPQTSEEILEKEEQVISAIRKEAAVIGVIEQKEAEVLKERLKT